MILEVDVELDGCVATISWPKRPVTLDAAGITALMRDLSLVRASLDSAQIGKEAGELHTGAARPARGQSLRREGARGAGVAEKVAR